MHCVKSKMKALVCFLWWGIWGFALGYGANIEVAKADRNTWIYPIDSAASFDFASKMEMLVFVQHFQALQNLDDTALQAYIKAKVQNPNLSSMRMYLSRTQAKILANFRAIAQTQSTQKLPYDFLPNLKTTMQWEDVLRLSQYATHNLPPQLQAWYKSASAFYTQYLAEQLRLSALFPRITSEILPLQDSHQDCTTPQHCEQQEILGDTLQDKHFILTFDDGPTPKGGNTDKLIALLKTLHIQAMFFVLGENLHKRNDVTQLYTNMIVGYHGDMHIPHTKPDVYKNAPIQSQNVATLGKKPANASCYFRPPYGQRDTQLLQMLKDSGCKVVLWNIDSQDWGHINPQEMYDRIFTLSLLWRSGIILFHDVHTKSYEILPKFVKTLQMCGIQFDIPAL